MSMKTTAAILHLLYRAKVPVLMEGVMGIGKTSLAYQLHARICKEKNQAHDHEHKSTLDGREMAKLSHVGADRFGLWACSAANLTIEELIGYPRPSDDGDINYARSHNFIPPPDHRGGGIWMVDELNLGSQEVERALMSLALEGRYLDYVLPPDIFIITSQNPAVGEYQSRRLNPPTTNRFCWIKVESNSEETLGFFTNNDFHPAILECLAEHADTGALNPHQEKTAFEIDQVATSRSWEFVNRVMEVATPDEIKTIGLLVFGGLLGSTVATNFHKFALEKGERSIPIDEVLKDYGYDPDTYHHHDTSHEKWPMTPVRKKVLKVADRASVRVDLVNLSLVVLFDRLKKIGEDVKAAHAKASKGSIFEAMNQEQRGAIINAMAFLCDLPPDQVGGQFLRKFSPEMFAYTFKAMARHRIASDYHDHWELVSKQAQAESEA